jgi:LuxR family transcriptional regulator, maltose regulon positive regulatory protein
LKLLERLTLAGQQGGRGASVIETLALQALVHHALGGTRAALDAISEALERAEREGFLRVFIDEGLPTRELLRHATARGIAGAYTRTVLAAFDASPGAAHVTPGGSAPAAVFTAVPRTPDVLTPRELEILRLLAAGLRNQEIAQQLFISPATVKRHIGSRTFPICFAGVVESAGAQVTRFRCGDAVYGVAVHAFGNYLCVRQQEIAMMLLPHDFAAAARAGLGG